MRGKEIGERGGLQAHEARRRTACSALPPAGHSPVPGERAGLAAVEIRTQCGPPPVVIANVLNRPYCHAGARQDTTDAGASAYGEPSAPAADLATGRPSARRTGRTPRRSPRGP